MAGFTNFYKLAYFDLQDRLNQGINVQREIDRFVMIDSQIAAIYDVFGDGVISGWSVFDNGFSDTAGISIGITSGSGIISKKASQTVVPRFINNIPANSTVNIYATAVGSTPLTRQVKFQYSLTFVSIDSILIATVVTGNSSITSVNNSVRTSVFYQQTILDEINAHKHRGTPTKIDLNREVKNELSGARIDGFDASKITTGRLDKDRIPTIKHTDLDNVGVLTHAQLDTLAESLNDINQELFGNITSINLLKQIIFVKSKFSNVDRYFLNTSSYIPGVSQANFIDTDASTATIDNNNGCIIGLDSGTSYLYTKNFTLPSLPKRIMLTSHSSTPEGSTLNFAVNTTNSVDFSDYQLIDENVTEDLSSIDNNLRIGIKFTYTEAYDPFGGSFDFEDGIEFNFLNATSVSKDFHFRIKFYTNSTLTDLAYTAFSQADQSGWLVDAVNAIPSTGYTVNASETVTVFFAPSSASINTYQLYYIVLDIWDGNNFVSETDSFTFIYTQSSNSCDANGYLPQLKNFAFMLELEDDKKIQLNL